MSQPPPEREEHKRPTPVREGLEQKDGTEERAGRAPLTPARSLEPPPAARPVPSGEPPPQAPASAPAQPAQPVPEAAPEQIEPPPAVPAEAERATFLLGGQEWVVTVEGRGRTGSGLDTGAALLLLAFATGAEPESPVFETLCAARSLEDLGESQLVELLAAARPHRAPPDKPQVFSDTRARKKEL